MSAPKFDVVILELIPFSQSGSGFVREDTAELPQDQQISIMHPKNRVIMNTSVIKVESEKTKGTYVNVVTRSMYNQEEIIKDKQDEAKMITSVRDKIVFVNGFRTVPNDGAFVGEYKWIKSHAQNDSNPNKPLKADGSPLLQPVFREVRAAAKAHDKNIYDLQLAQALGFINKELVKQKGSEYEYNEEAIEAVGRNFAIQADSPSQKVASLIALAKADPQAFLNLAKNSEQTVTIEIKHAIQLGLIKIDGTAIVYAEGETPIKKTAPAQTTDEKKLEGLGSYFLKVEGKEAYELFREKLAAAKEAALA